MEFISFFLVWLATATLLQEPENLVVLLEEADGSVGVVEVVNDGGTQTLRQAGTAVQIADQNTSPTAPQAISEAEIRNIFGKALDAAPTPPRTFLLYFEAGTANLTAQSQALIAPLIAEIRSRKIARVSVIGHTDTAGNDALNYRLALDRAATLRDSLVADGIDEAIVAIRSHGEKDLLVKTPDNASEAQNRRVEVTVW